jgi:hypothetical protein
MVQKYASPGTVLSGKFDRLLALFAKKEKIFNDVILNLIKNNKNYNGTNGANVILFLQKLPSIVPSYDFIDKSEDNLTESIETISIDSSSGLVLIDSYISKQAIDNTLITAGTWDFNFFTKTNSTTNADNRIITEVYKRTAEGIETLLFSVTSPEAVTWNTEIKTINNYTSLQGEYPCNVTDYLVVKIYGTTDSALTLNLSLIHSGKLHKSFIVTPFQNIPNRSFSILPDSTNNDKVTTPKAVYDYVSLVYNQLITLINDSFNLSKQYTDNKLATLSLQRISIDPIMMYSDAGSESYFDEDLGFIYPALVDSYIVISQVPPFEWDTNDIFVQIEWERGIGSSALSDVIFSISARSFIDNANNTLAFGPTITLTDTGTVTTKRYITDISGNIIPSGVKSNNSCLEIKVTRLGTVDITTDIEIKNIRLYYSCKQFI